MYIDHIWPFTTFISRNKHNKNIRLRLYWLRLRVAEAEVQTSHASVQRQKKPRSHLFCIEHWWIQNFSGRSVLIQSWLCQSIIWQNSTQKLQEKERNWTTIYHFLCSHLDPPMKRESYTLCQPSRSSTSVMSTLSR